MNRCANKDQSLLFDLFKAFAQLERRHKEGFCSTKGHIFLHACATCSALPNNKSTMDNVLLKKDSKEFGERNCEPDPDLINVSDESGFY